MPSLKKTIQNALNLFYPHHCTGCGSDLVEKDELLCLHCLHDLPHTGFEKMPGNLTEKVFYGRIPLQAAYSQFYFAKHQLVQHLIHQLKYKGNIAIGEYMGKIMGNSIVQSSRFGGVDYLVPLPLHADKEFKRGYNQAEVLCRGIQQTSNIPLLKNLVLRQKFTETQTKKHRIERWENVDDSFVITDKTKLQHKHLLLVDDVVTTGATLESCANTLRNIEGVRISIATLAIASK